MAGCHLMRPWILEVSPLLWPRWNLLRLNSVRHLIRGGSLWSKCPKPCASRLLSCPKFRVTCILCCNLATYSVQFDSRPRVTYNDWDFLLVPRGKIVLVFWFLVFIFSCSSSSKRSVRYLRMTAFDLVPRTNSFLEVSRKSVLWFCTKGFLTDAEFRENRFDDRYI